MEFSQPKLSHRTRHMLSDLNRCCHIELLYIDHFYRLKIIKLWVTIVYDFFGRSVKYYNNKTSTDWSGRWDSDPLSTMATVLQTAPALQLRRSPIMNEGNIRQHLLRFALQVWQENGLNLLSLRLIPFLKHGFVFNFYNRPDSNRHVCHKPRRIRTAKAITLLCHFSLLLHINSVFSHGASPIR